MNIQKQYFICKINDNVISLEDFIKRHIVRNNKSSRQGKPSPETLFFCVE